MNGQYFVKFVKYNNHILSDLINKNIKFSTVYEFNDFNELHYIGPPPDWMTEKVITLIREKIIDRQYQWQLIKNIKMGNYEKNFINELCEYIKNYHNSLEIPKEYFQCMLETIAYSSVGIFCLSHINIFKDDSAQLMFAHYAENLSGLALIYEIKHPLNPTRINYAQMNKKPGSFGQTNRVSDWVNANYNYNDMDDFLNKSSKWEYEKEHRLFNTPGITSDNNIILKAILHTRRLNDTNKQTLLTLNEKIYENKILIEEIKPSHSKYFFKISETNVYDWLCENLIPT